ncbi:MAG: NAD(P)H-binding protein [Acidimicrobiaceae bacterium]|nr:NAD(P)H-binding protein [Acidimicrobiaceae bacterium]MDE0268478.1 NAD(P)H-binding protein [Acidimicrobiaceae bacterium]
MVEDVTHTVTGATGYTGRYITELLLEQGNKVQSITGHPDRHNPFGKRVKTQQFNFEHPDLLEQALTGTDTLFNTYWIRFNRGNLTYQRAVKNTITMFKAAKAAGVRRVVHISITNPDLESSLPYFRGKAYTEEALRRSGLSYAILRPTVLYSTKDILLNNIAWTVRKFPLVLMPGSGRCLVQPVFVEDLAQLAVEAASDNQNTEIDAVGPEVFTYKEMVKLIRGKVGARCLVLPAPKLLTYVAVEILGLFLNDVVITWDEIKGLCADLMVSKSSAPAPAKTKLSEWLDNNGSDLGLHYASEIQRHY